MAELRESEELEFKKTTAELRQGIVSLTSMLNKHGYGTVFFGIQNNGAVCEYFTIGADTARDISQAVRENIRPNVIPSICVEEYQGKDVIRVTAEGTEAPYTAYGRYYIRSDDEDLIMNNDQLLTILESHSSGTDRWETRSSGHTVDCIDEKVLIEYINKCNDKGRLDFMYRDMMDTLRHLRLIYKDDILNNAGYYLFSSDGPLTLKTAVYNTDEMLSFADIGEIRGNIRQCVDEGISYIKRRMSWSAEIVGTRREEIPEVPVRSIREVVVNSFAHMRYETQPFNEIYLTPSEICAFNPGPMADNCDPDSFASGEKRSVLRNPIIAEILYYEGTIDKFGTGFRRIFDECGKEGVRYRYDNTDQGFMFRFIRRPQQMTVTRSVLTIEESEILHLMRADPHISVREITERTGMSTGVVNGLVASLKNKGVLKREGARKNGFWIIESSMTIDNTN
ncbi:MAG: putative DNA binding domain-containing protein [Spirochaetales bacterium]|nr:putative DNA binding domain-containing protein [Spirochaetales bacterium]